jgi:sulfoxide reductase heme-binding subunit YedZ
MPAAEPAAKIGLSRGTAWRAFKPAVFVLCALPLSILAYNFFLVFSERDIAALGPDPKNALLHTTGQDALILLLITLTITPIRRLTGWNRLISIRRMLGVWTFTYALTHLTIYLTLDQLCYSFATCEWNAIWQDILKRRFIFVGQLAFAILLLLAITSTGGWVRRLKKNWTRLHRLVYVAGAAGVIHYVWIQKSDISEPLPFAIWLGAVLLFRVFWAIRKGRQSRPSAVTS